MEVNSDYFELRRSMACSQNENKRLVKGDDLGTALDKESCYSTILTSSEELTSSIIKRIIVMRPKMF